MKPFLTALAITAAAIVFIQPLRQQAIVVAENMGILRLGCGSALYIQVYPSPCTYKFDLFGLLKFENRP